MGTTGGSGFVLWTRVWGFVALVGSLMGFNGCGNETSGSTERTAETQQALEPVPSTLTIALPGNMAPQRTPIFASDSLWIGDRAKIEKKYDGYATIVNTGATTTQVGVEAIVGNLWSQAPATIGDRTRIEGFARSSSTVATGQDVVITGDVEPNASLGPLRESTWEPVVPANDGDIIALEPTQALEKEPGGYGYVLVKQGATLTLSTGTYGFHGGVTIESGARLVVDDSEGPVVAYVRDGFTFRGTVEKARDSTSNKVELLVVSLGTAASFIEAPFRGTVFAPKANLVLQPLVGSGQHFGAFFAKNVNVEADVTVSHLPFPWSKVLPPGTVEMKDSPVVLKPVEDGPGGESGVAEVATETPVTFDIPRDIWTILGNAGHGTFKFRFRSPDGVTTVCTYTGGSPVAAPTTELDRAKGRRYTFPTCTNGYQPGDSATADWFEGEMVSDATNEERTTVSLTLGGGCSGTLPAALSPEEVVALRQDFDWTAIGTLSETDPDGLPALWHGLIYIEHREQLEALDRWRVYWNALPISERYMNTLGGKCGRVEHSRDDKGVVVYAVFPARLFNLLRAFALEADAANVAPPFKFIIPSTPDQPEFVNSDGSLKYSALASSGYAAWLAAQAQQQPFLDDVVNFVGDAADNAWDWMKSAGETAGDAVETGISYVGTGWDEFVDWTGTAIDDTWEAVQGWLGDFVEAFYDNIDVSLDVQILNRDPLFKHGGRMLRAWGPQDSDGKRPALVPTGIRASIRQWGFGFLPVHNWEFVGADGKVTIPAIEGQGARGGNGLCFELENDDAMMSSDIIANEVCNFDSVVFDDFDHDTHNFLATDHPDLHAFAQIVDGASYVREVIGWEPHKVDVLTGAIANTVTNAVTLFKGSVAMAPCLDFPGVGAAVLSTGLNIIGSAAAGVVGSVSAPMIMKDIWWPDNVDGSVDSRGVMTHEYGHFVMCSLLFDKGAGPGALTPLLIRPFEGQPTEADAEASIVTESFADTFAMQVVGGSNYIRSHHSTDPGLTASIDYRMGFCTDLVTGIFTYPGGPTAPPVPGADLNTATPYCMEWNYQHSGDYDFEPDGFHDRLAKIESTIHDAFDRADSSRRLTSQPWNGDVWRASGPNFGLTFSSSAYIAVPDEPASLSGVGWQFWVENWLERGGAPDVEQYLGGLSDAMAQQGNNWCDRCEVFAIHEIADTGPAGTGDPSAYVPASFGDHFQRWQICANQFQAILGAAPEPYVNINASCAACGPLEYSNGGVCTACPVGEVPRGDHCEPCLGASVPSLDNSCVTCGGYEIAVGGVCQQCPFGQVADSANNSCVPCPADQTIDLATLGAGSCGVIVTMTTAAPTPGDLCPETYWIDVTNLDVVTALGCTHLAIEAVPDESLTALTCADRVSHLQVFDPAMTLLYGHGAQGSWHAGNCPPPTPTNPVCVDPPRCDFGVSYSISAASIAGGLDAVRLSPMAEDLNGPTAIPAKVRLGIGGLTPTP